MAISLDPAQQNRSVKVRPKSKRKSVPSKRTRSLAVPTKATARTRARRHGANESDRVASDRIPHIPFPFKGNLERLNQPVAAIWNSARRLVSSPIVASSYEIASQRIDALIENSNRAKGLLQKSGICATIAKFKGAIKNFDDKVKKMERPA